MGFVGRKPTNAPLTSDDIPNGIIGAADLAAGLSKLTWDTTAKTSGFTASANTGYVCNTTSSAFTVTLPASPTAGDTIQLVDYAGTFDTNILTINPNGNKIEGGTANLILDGEREGATLTYIDSTQGWLATSGINEGTDALAPNAYSIDFLVVAGGGGAGHSRGGGGGGGGYRTSTQSVTIGTVITVTVGDGGAAGATTNARGTNGSDSSISGSGLTTITSAGGGGGGAGNGTTNDSGLNGGSGGGGSGTDTGSTSTGGSGNTPSTSPSQGNNGGIGRSDGVSFIAAGGGGGAGATGSNGNTTGNGANGGAGSASSITGSSVTRAGGGAGGGNQSGGSGGSGGGGNTNTSGTANTGGGGGGSSTGSTGAGSGGKGVVILSVPTAKYSSTSTGSPTVTTSGSNTILQFNGSGSYTA